jgi:hypothetical protein
VRLRADVAADTKQDRHVMSQNSSECRRFPVPLRWLRAGGDLSRPGSPRSMHPAPVDTLQAPPEMPLSLSRVVTNSPRLRALALFGRRLAERVEASRDSGAQKPAQVPPIGKGFLSASATLVGAAMCPTCLRGT